ncbi:DNA topoisomerase IB [Sphingomonas cavernae]|uniref:DNA topoisomerase n=1 Tax=Sphingomonas cavernae TaxID=2320861 RepID=A0A418WKW6_9SPHN|nr:DNA topoisomerase IB [Sphingomonas cavernae]RJF90691.1 DNA topoisomerase IB [Sphingomonas cavernae]
MPKLCYVDDSLPGITRRRRGRAWAYFDPKGDRITDRYEIDRLNAIALPPAYNDAWYCPSADGHIQAIGYDQKGRKQYRYHPDFRAQQESAKYDRCADFGRALPLIRARVESDLRRGGLVRERAIAAVVRLLDLGRVRVGNEAYVKANRSFGATTLRTRHAEVRGQTLHLSYRAKSGKNRVLRVTDGSLARFVKRCQDLPGQHLFQYLDDTGTPQPVSSTDVNAYIREAMGDDFSAKHFRTWGASVLAFEALHATAAPISVTELLEPVAAALGNTPAIARKSYVHPALMDLAGKTSPLPLHLPRATRYLSRAERGLIDWLDSPHAKSAKSAIAA